MLKKLKKLAIAVAICYLTPAVTLAANTPIKILKNPDFTDSSLTNEKIIELVKQNIDLSSEKNIFQARVQTIFNSHTKKPDHLLVYLLSSKTYSLTVTKIQLNPNFDKTTITSHYHLTKQDLAQQPHVDLSKVNVDICPKKDVEIVAATPVPEITTADAAIKNVAREARAYGYKTAKMLGDEADVLGYVAYLSCPNLKGFYNIGHGFEEGIMLADGVLSSEAIKAVLKNRLHEKVTVVFNSCEVFKDPLRSSVIEDADAQKYAGGISPLYIGPSEQSSQCFWSSAFSKHLMTPAIEYCNKHFDSEDEWGIGGKGDDTLQLPQPA